MKLTFGVYHDGTLVSEHVFEEAMMYEDFLEETAHTLARHMGGVVAVWGKAWDCDDDGPFLREWWAFSYVRAEYTILRFDSAGMREMEWEYVPTMVVPEYQVRVRLGRGEATRSLIAEGLA